jgi:putative membrane protein
VNRFIFVLCFSLVACLPSLAQDYNVSQTPMTNGSLPRPGSDHAFVENSLDALNGQLVLSKLAVSKSTNPDVKKFAQRVIDEDNTEAAWVLSGAKFFGVKPPQALTPRDAKFLADLKAASPADFDQMYLSSYLTIHHEDIENLMTMTNHPRGSGLADHAQAQLDITQRRGDAAKALDKKLKGKK